MRGQSGDHPIRNIILAVIFIFLFVQFYPAEGFSSNTNTDSSAATLEMIDPPEDHDKRIEWTVLRHKGYHEDLACWMLQLDRRDMPPNSAETGDFCAKDRKDYDSHVDGSVYVTEGGWTKNLFDHIPRDESHAA